MTKELKSTTRIMTTLIPLKIGMAIYITKTPLDVIAFAKRNNVGVNQRKNPAVRFFLNNRVMIFWDAYLFNHQDVIYKTSDFSTEGLKKFSLELNEIDLNKWHRGSVGFYETENDLKIEDLDVRSPNGETEIIEFFSCT